MNRELPCICDKTHYGRRKSSIVPIAYLAIFADGSDQVDAEYIARNGLLSGSLQPRADRRDYRLARPDVLWHPRHRTRHYGWRCHTDRSAGLEDHFLFAAISLKSGQGALIDPREPHGGDVLHVFLVLLRQNTGNPRLP